NPALTESTRPRLRAPSPSLYYAPFRAPARTLPGPWGTSSMPAAKPPVAIIMGSRSDWPTMKHAADALDALCVAYEAKVVSAHRTPDRMYAFAKGAKAAGVKVIVAGAGGAAHPP